MTEYWAYQYFADPSLANEVEDESFDEDDILAQWEAEAEANSAEQTTSTATPEQLADPNDWEPLE